MDFHGRDMPFLGIQMSISGGFILGQKHVSSQEPCTAPFTCTVLIWSWEENSVCPTEETILLLTSARKWAAFLTHCLYFLKLLSAQECSSLEQ